MDVSGGQAQPDNVQVENAPPKPRSVALGLTRTYATNWKVKDALRELYQNWKDAILQTYAISLVNFTPLVEATPDEIRIIVKGNIPLPMEAGGPMAQDILGYIRFNKIQGSAEFTNLRSSLDEQCLEIGTTTKSDDDRLIGGHGEGLKIAALVLCRENHHVKISANGYYWNFGFNGLKSTNFYCRLAPAKGKRVLSGLAARVREDVSVLVEKGHTDAGRRLQRADFVAWMSETLDLHAPSGRVRTLSGDLLLAQIHRGHLYLKGIRVPQARHNGQGFYYGYNLLRGNVDRDRQRLVDGHSVTEAIHSIWNAAIIHDQSVALPCYIELLRDHSASADAIEADQFVPEATARKMWEVLSWEARTDDAFYYQKSCQSEHDPVIRSELKKQPRPLSEVLWKILRRYSLVREPMEELQHQFRNSQNIELPDTPFAHGLARTLRGLLALNPRTATIKVVFVRCDIHTVDLAYSKKEDLLYVHEKWLQFSPASSFEELEGSLHPGLDAFFCQHVVGELYRRTLAIVFSQACEVQLAHDITLLLELSHRKLRQMPRMIEASQAEEGSAIQISFYTGHSHAFVVLHGERVHYLVALHRHGCSGIVTDLIYRKDRDTCNCPRATVPLSSRTILFQNLSPGPWVPMVVKQSNHNEASEDQCTLKAQDGALIGVFPRIIYLPHRDSAEQHPLADAPHRVPSNVSSSDIYQDSGAHETASANLPVDFTLKDRGVQADDDCQEQQIPDQDSTANNPDVVELASAALDVHSAQSEDGSIYSPPSPLSGPDYPNTVTCPFEPTPSSHPVSSDAELDSIADVGHNFEVTGEPKIGADSRNYTTSPSKSAFARPSGDTVWWETWAAKGQKIAPGSSRHAEEDFLVDGPWQLCGQHEQFYRGTYIQTTIAHENGSSTNRQVLYIHNIVEPRGRSHLPTFLVVTRYSFLADHPALKRADIAVNQELLLHFRNADHMAEEGDAEIIAARDVTIVEAGAGPVEVSFINQEPRPVTGFFARFAAWDNSPKESLFVTPLGPYLFKAGRPAAPCFAALPAASVFDLSPGDTGLSIGFVQAGYRICAAIGFDEGRHQLWKTQHSDAAIYPGDAVSVITDLDSQREMLSNAGDHEVPRIVIISGRGLILDEIQNCSEGDAPNVVPDSLESFTLCDLAAQSPILSPNFIVLALFIPSAQDTILTSPLTSPVSNTIKSLLERGYSVTLRSLPNTNTELTSLVLLAAPGGTNPQWIDDSLSDLQVSRALQSQTAGMPQGQAGIEHEVMDMTTHSSMVKPADTTSDGLSTADRQHAHDPSFTTTARDIATTLTRVIGEFSKQPQVPCSGLGPMQLEEAQDRVKRQKYW